MARPGISSRVACTAWLKSASRSGQKTSAGKALYQLRQPTVEPIFGIIKAALGFRHLLLRDLEKVSLEWTLVTLADNLKRLHYLGPMLKNA